MVKTCAVVASLSFLLFHAERQVGVPLLMCCYEFLGFSDLQIDARLLSDKVLPAWGDRLRLKTEIAFAVGRPISGDGITAARANTQLKIEERFASYDRTGQASRLSLQLIAQL